MNIKSILISIKQFIKLIQVGHKKIRWIMLLGGLSTAAIPFISLYLTSYILDRILVKDFDGSVKYIIMILVSNLVLGIISRACRQSVDVLGETCFNTVKQRLTDKAFTMEYEEFEKTETLDSIRKIDSGENGSGGIKSQIESIYTLMIHGFQIIFSLAFVVILFSKVSTSNTNFFTSHWSSLLLILIYTVFLYLGIKRNIAVNQKRIKMQKENEHKNSIAGYLVTLSVDYNNGKDIRIYGMKKLFLSFFNKFTKNITFYLDWGKMEGRSAGINGFLSSIAACFSYIYIGAKAIYGVISIGNVLMYAGAINQFVESIERFAAMFTQIAYRAEYLKTYDEFIHRPNMHYDGTLPIEKRDDASYEFEFQNVSFQYPDTDAKVLENINLRFKIGDKLALVGRNGAGKTTLIKLLCRLYEPTSGKILLNGIDIGLYDYTEYVQIFSVVFQDFELFSFPLDENVAASTTVDEEKVWNVIDQVGLRKKMESLPNAIHTHLFKDNGDGVDLSGGEAQKLAIARALYKDGPFVILDEPTAALDPIAEAEIYENFNDLIANKTAIYISHRMSSCKFCDDIVVLDNGKFAERGNHQELMSLNGIYASLYNTQAQYYE